MYWTSSSCRTKPFMPPQSKCPAMPLLHRCMMNVLLVRGGRFQRRELWSERGRLRCSSVCERCDMCRRCWQLHLRLSTAVDRYLDSRPVQQLAYTYLVIALSPVTAAHWYIYSLWCWRLYVVWIQDKTPLDKIPRLLLEKIQKQLKQPACNSIVFKYLATNSGAVMV